MANINNFWIVLSVFVAESLACTHHALRSHDKDRIYNGHKAVPGQFPYFVFVETMQNTESEYGVCGGSLIGDEWVLTAAHCVSEANRVDVYVGNIGDCYEQVYTITSDKIWINPRYENLHSQHDVALLRIPKVVLCDAANIIRLPNLISSPEHPRYYNEYALTTGLGMINSVDYAKDLQWARLKIIDNNDCSKYLHHIIKEKICALSSADLASPSLGDSGGPLALESTGELVGITVAIAEPGADKGYPAVFARVTDYLEWIKSISGIYY